MQALNRNHRRGISLLFVGIAVMIALGFTLFHATTTKADHPQPGIHVTNGDGATAPTIGTTLQTSEGTAITLTGIEKDGSRWLFHIQVQNATSTHLEIMGSTDHRFILPAKGSDGSTQDYLLTSPLTNETATHAPLAHALDAKGSLNGWLAADVSQLGYATPPTELVYQYGPLQSMKCPKGSTPNSPGCAPVTLYHVLIWNIAGAA